MKKFIYLLFTFCTLLANAQAGSLDTSFNTSDVGFGKGDGANSDVLASVIQPDGKMIIVGSFSTYNGTSINRICRLNTDGNLDPTFVVGTGASSVIHSIALQSDGKIIIGGDFQNYNGIGRERIARLNADGTLDTTFAVGTGASNTVQAVAVQTDGKIIVGGRFTMFNNVNNRAIVRLNTNGSVDSSFDTTARPSGDVYALALQPDGKILVGGAFSTYNSIARSNIARINSDGTVDTGFTIGTGASSTIRVIKMQLDGKILIGGEFSQYNGVANNRIARLQNNGTLDTAFTTGTGINGSILAIQMLSDGKIVIGGDFTQYNAVNINNIALLNNNGALDTTFITGTGPASRVNTIAQQADQKIVVGGSFTSYNERHAPRVVRISTNGAMDTTFNVVSGFNNAVSGTVQQTDGKIIVCGGFNNYFNLPTSSLLRLNIDGSVDTSFSTGTGFNRFANANKLALQPDGKIIAIGNFTSYNGSPYRGAVRINSNGTLDTTFNIGTGFTGAVNNLVLQPDGKIIFVGSFTNFNGFNINRIIRLNSDGSRDTTFNPGTGPEWITNVVSLQTDGKIIIGGNFKDYNGITSGGIARLNINGLIDTTFNVGLGFNDPSGISVNTIQIQSDGKIIAAGSFPRFNSTLINRVARLNTDGTLDTTFTIGTGANNPIFSSALQADGKVILGGQFTTFNNVAINRLMRLNTDGTLDATFNVGTGLDQTPFSATLLSDSKLLIGGSFIGYNGIGRNRLARVNTTVHAPVASATQTICGSGTLANLTVTGTNIKWYSAATAGVLLASNTTVVNNTTYFASQTAGSIESASRTAVLVFISPAVSAPNAPTIDQQNTVSNSTGGGILQWQSFTAGFSGNLTTIEIRHGNPVSPIVATATFTLRVYDGEGTAGTLLGTTQAAYPAQSGFTDFAYNFSGITLVQGQKYTFELTTPTANTGFVRFNNLNSYLAGVSNLSTTTDMIFKTFMSTNTNQTFCGPTAIVQLTAVGTNVKWYDQAVGGSPLANSTAVTSTTYFVTQSSGTCESPRVQVAVAVNQIPNAPIAAATQFSCTPITVANLAATGTNIKWYSTPIGGVALASNSIVVSGNYFATQTSAAGCESVSRTQVVAAIGTPAPTGQSVQIYAGVANLSNFSAVGTNIKWYATPTAGTELPTSTTVTNNVVYYASQTLNGCESASRIAVAVRRISDNPQIICGLSPTVANIVLTPTAGSTTGVFASATSTTALAATSTIASETYFIEQNREIGTNSVILSGLTFPNAVTTDATGKILFAEFGTAGAIKRMNADGTSVQVLRNGDFINDVKVAANGQIFYISRSGFTGGIFKMNADGTGLTAVAPNFSTAYNLTFDSLGRLLVTDSNGNRVVRMNPDGTNVVTITTAVTVPQGIVSLPDDSIVITAGTSIVKMNADGTNLTTLATGISFLIDIERRANGKLVFTIGNTNTGQIRQINADGTNMATLLSNINGPRSLTIENNDNVVFGLADGSAINRMLLANETSARIPVALSVVPIPDAPIATSPQTYCGGTRVASLTATGTAIKWYSSAAGGNAFTPTTALTTGNYFASQTNLGGCESASRTLVAVTVPSTTVIPTVPASQSFCIGTTVASLAASGTNIVWYNAATAGAVVASNTALVAGDYFASQTVNGCESPQRAQTNVTIIGNLLLNAPTVTQPSCATSTGSITINVDEASAKNIRTLITDSLDATDTTQTGRLNRLSTNISSCVTPSVFPNLTSTTGSRVYDSYSFTNNSINPVCVTTKKTNVSQFDVFMVSYLNSFNPTNLATNYLGDCGFSSFTNTSSQIVPAGATLVQVLHSVTPNIFPGAYTLEVTGIVPTPIEYSIDNGANWQSTPTFSNLAVGNYNALVRPASTTCVVSYSANPIIITAPVYSAAPTANAIQSFCTTAIVANLTPISTATTTIKWYASATATTPLAATTTLSTATNYFATQTNASGCESVSRTPVLVTFGTPAPTATATQYFCPDATVANLLPISTATSTIKWYASANATTPLPVTTALISGTVYYASQTNVSGCESASRTQVNVLLDPVPVLSIIAANSPATFCGGSSRDYTVAVTNAKFSSLQYLSGGIPTNIVANQATFSVLPSTPLVANLVNTPSNGCVAFAAGSLAGKIALIARGTCTFGVKAKNAQDAGAIGVLIYNNLLGELTPSVGDPSVTIPVYGISSTSANSLIAAMTASQIQVTLDPGDNFTYQWSTGQTTATINTGVLNANTTFSVTVTNTRAGCVATQTVQVLVDPVPTTPTITPSGSTTICTGSAVTLTSSALTGNLWSTGETSQAITVSTTGNYTVRVTSASGCQSPTSTITVVSVAPPTAMPSITANGTTSFCQGGNVILTSSATTGNLWSTGETTQSITVSTSGNYTVRATTNGCQSATSTATIVTVTPLTATPSISANGVTTFCQGGNVILTSSSATGNLWSTGATTQSITVSASGSFTVRATTNGCQSATSTATTVTVTPLTATPSISANGVTTFCQGGNVILTSSSATGNLWSTGATTQSITVSSSGNYTVRATTNGCQSATSTATSVTVAPLTATPSISANGVTTFCQGGNVILTSSSATGNLWSTGATTQSITVSTSGSYTVRATTNGCQSATSTATTVTVNLVALSPAGFASNYVVGTPITAINLVASGVAGSGYTYSVSSGNLPNGLTLSNGIISGAPTAASTGSYTITAIATEGGCSASQTYSFAVTCPNLQFVTTSLPNRNYNVLYSQPLSVSNATSALTYSISSGSLPAGFNLSANGIISGSSIAIGTATFTVLAIDVNGCSVSRTFSIGLNQIPITVTANVGTKVYGTPDPVLTYTVVPSLQAGDSFTGVLGRVSGENAGTYAINQGTLSAGANYIITYVGANFSITKAPQTITWNQNLVIGCDGLPTYQLNATATSGLSVNYTSQNTNIANVLGSLLNIVGQGTAAITASQAGNSNYDAATNVIQNIVVSQNGLIRKHWRDVLFFDNSSNAFSNYQWFKNGVAIAGANQQYYKEIGNLSGTYHATALRNGNLITSCTLDISPSTPEFDIRVMPNPSAAGTTFEVDTTLALPSLQNAQILVFSYTGALVSQTAATGSKTIVNAPNAQGFYIVRLQLNNGKVFSTNLLVK